MNNRLSVYPEFKKSIQNNEVVYIFGAGISSALTDNKSCSWWKWINDGINYVKNDRIAAGLREAITVDSSTENLVKIVGEVIKITKAEGSYFDWMKRSFEVADVSNEALADTLKKILITQDIIATTNYDLLLEKATGLKTITYKEPALALNMIENKKCDSVLHLHGVFDSVHGIDNIIANQEQYNLVLNDKGAQFIQNILGTKTLIFVGCGQTTEDGNVSQFIQFAGQHLRINIPYYFLYKANDAPVNIPDNIKLVEYGDDYFDLPQFLEEMVQERLRTKIANNRIIGRSIYNNISSASNLLAEYHYSQESIPFCGRQDELQSLLKFIASKVKFSWWSITGQAGAGKSRLALELLRKLPSSWFGFFLNDTVTMRDIENFVPFTDTLIVIDYVNGRETLVAGYIRNLYELFSTTKYELRILLIERDNRRETGSWYSKLIQRFGKYDTIRCSENSNEFLNIEDLDDNAVEQFIGYVCSINRLDNDPQRDKALKEAYARKFERLRFRPLYVQMFVEAWINNDFSFPHYDSYEDLLKYTLEREQEKWLYTLDGDQKCCNALLRLIVRANISGKLELKSIPDIYKKDWGIVEEFIKNHSFDGKQRKEEKVSIISSICQNIDNETEVIAPMFPDIIKEYMFYFYSDEESLADTMREIWQNSASDFTLFITRCLTDFPENDFFQRALNAYDQSTEDINALLGRLEILKRWVIKDDDDPIVLYRLVCNEYDFWKSIVVPKDNSTHAEMMAMLKVAGLNFVAEQFAGWANYDLSDMIEAVDISLNVYCGKATEAMKHYFLQEHITKLSKSGFFSEAGYLRDKLEQMLEKEEELPWGSMLHMQNRNSEMMEYILNNDFNNAYKTLLSMDDECNYQDIESVRVLAQSCFNIDNLSSSMCNEKHIGTGLDVIQKALLVYPDDPAVKARAIGCRLSILQHEYIIHGFSSSNLRNNIDELERQLDSIPIEDDEVANDALNISWGILLALKINVAINDSYQLEKLIKKADGIICAHPDFEYVAASWIQAIHALHNHVLKTKVSHDEVEKCFKYVELNHDSDSLREAFFEMLEDSVDARNRDNYKTKWVMFGAIQGAKYDPFVGSGLQEVDLETEIMMDMVDYLQRRPFVRSFRKIGPNEPCPCGSGRKFKKCCRGNGLFD